MEVDEAAAAAAAGAAVGEEGKLKETTVKDGGEGATESVGPKDADGVVMVLNEYRPGGHNGEGYTKGWYCDGKIRAVTPTPPFLQIMAFKKKTQKKGGKEASKHVILPCTVVGVSVW